MCWWLCYSVNVWHGECDEPDGGTWYTSVTHDSVLMLPFSCSHRPVVCITRPNCKARSDEIWNRPKELAIFHILTKLNISTLNVGTSVGLLGYYGGQGGQPLRMPGWANWKPGWAKWKKIFGASRRILSNKMFAHPGLKPCRRPWKWQWQWQGEWCMWCSSWVIIFCPVVFVC